MWGFDNFGYIELVSIQNHQNGGVCQAKLIFKSQTWELYKSEYKYFLGNKYLK